MEKTKRNFTETPNTDVVGHRFGTIHCIKHVPNSRASFECVCDCGNHFVTHRSALIYGRVFSCPECAAKNRFNSIKVHAHIIEKYGSVTDYVPDSSSDSHCSYCGSPLIYNKKRQLCRTCNSRFNRNGSPEYVVRNLCETKRKQAQERGQLRKEQARQSLDIMPNSPLATQMADMYLNQNMSYQQIADAFNCSRQYVHSLLHYHEYRTRNNKQQEIYRRRKKIKK